MCLTVQTKLLCADRPRYALQKFVIPCSVDEKPGPAKTLVGTEWQGLSGIDGGHCGMLAGGMQIFDALVKE